MIEIKNLNLTIGKRKIFSDFNFKLEHNEKIGIIGGAGSGKSTLIDVILKKIKSDSGELVINGDPFLINKDSYRNYSNQVSNVSNFKKLKNTLQSLADNTILLLDEPTQNIDLNEIDWLVAFLNERKNLTALVISSDRYFMSKVCSKIIQIGEDKQFSFKFKCGKLLPETSDHLEPIILEVKNLARRQNGILLFKDVNFVIRQKQKVAFVGKSLECKSVLLKALTEAIHYKENLNESQQGTIKFSKELKFFCFPRTYTIKAAELELEKLANSNANFLVLNNLTASLDLPMIKAAEEALKEFAGTIIFTDDDRAFVQAIANRIIAVTPRGTVDRISSYEEFLSNEAVRTQLKKKYKI